MLRLVALAALLASCFLPGRAEPILVLPLFNLSGAANLDWIGESVAETVRETLASESVLVLERSSRQQAFTSLSLRPYTQLTRASVIKLGEAVGASKVVYGSFEVSPANPESSLSTGALRISVQVLDLQPLKPGPETTVSGELEDLASLQDQVAWQALLWFLAPEKAPSEEQFRSRRRAVPLDAMENYIRGLLASNPEQQHRLLTQAVRLDPEFSQPCFQLGKFHWVRKHYRVAAGWLEKVSADDPHYQEATFLLGLSRYYMADYENALSAFHSVLVSLPLSEVWNNLGAAQSRLNLPEALASFKEALDGDPDDAVYQFNVGYSLWRNGEYDEAADHFRAVLDRHPGDSLAMTMLGRCLKRSGPRPTQTRVEALERLKHNYDELAHRRLQAVLASHQE